jgi:hypothetical protein
MKKILLILAFTTACCDVLTQGDPKPNIVVAPDVNYCKAGCEKLASLPGQDGKDGCLESRTIQQSDGGRTTCEDFCSITEKNGREINPKCWTTLNSCDEIESCRKDN